VALRQVLDEQRPLNTPSLSTSTNWC